MDIKERHFVLPISLEFRLVQKKILLRHKCCRMSSYRKSFIQSTRSWKLKRINEITKSEHGHK